MIAANKIRATHLALCVLTVPGACVAPAVFGTQNAVGNPLCWLFVIGMIAVRMGALKRPGLVGGLFVFFYGVARITGEQFREPDAQLGFLAGGLTMGMLLSIPMLVAGGIAIVCALRAKPRKA